MRFLMVLLLAACTPASIAPSSAPTPTLSPTATPQPTPDTGLVAACAALTEMRQTGTLVTIAGEALTGDYTADWTPAATALLDQMETTLSRLQAVPNVGPYQSWKQEALQIIVELSTVVERWETGLATLDPAAISEGTAHMTIATEHVTTLNGYASGFEARC